ncbi:helix-turn-helix domain-containing protein [Actinomycetospora termitidis]|uniref:Helix-turn-helix domain-containing protein n=1 Tax=Actinomycetospora termitidis TaxID=3053470 RepID=A0ABT7MBY0_9PSEU|nr:helix-turn-helix domain-containing protein [Actinomycetospora sp. Odt1-22]MDL5157497.1 helix-turn-helix domain-containing protein [Actinomycetospora sp. Odt1-22]
MTVAHPWVRDAAGPSLILPDGCLDVIVRPDGQVVVAGPDAVAREAEGDGRFRGVRFSHGVGALVLGVPAEELVGRTVPLDDVVGRVPDAGSWLRRRLADLPDDGPWAQVVFDASARGVPVAAIADEVGLSARTLQRRCRARFGYGPQHLHRVLRLQRALTRRREGISWADTAAAVGYVDQQHLSREARALTGRAPTALG